MRTHERERATAAVLALVLVAAFAGCLGDRPTLEEEGGTGGAGGLASGGAGGNKGTGGAGGKGTTGTGGAVIGSGGAGGEKGTGGVVATGGATGTGGGVATGGATGTGGGLATGGATGTGGGATGGVTGTGGVVATGGVKGTGGVTGTGGLAATGGVSGTGGIVATGGVTGTGGLAATGGVTGTGGTAPVCTLGQTRCVNNNTQAESCVSGAWGPAQNCMYTCIGTACGGSCNPGQQQCSGNTANMTCGTNYEYQTAVACPLPSPPNPICTAGHCAYHAGLDQSGGSDSLLAGYIYAVRFLAAANTQASRLGMFTTATGNAVRLGLYSETGTGMPSALLASTATLATANGAVEGPLPGAVSLTANTHYWIGAIASTTVGIGVTPGGVGFTYNNNPSGWSTLPSSFPTSGSAAGTTETADFYVVLQDQ